MQDSTKHSGSDASKTQFPVQGPQSSSHADVQPSDAGMAEPQSSEEERWENMLRMLVEFREGNPYRWPSKISKDPTERKIGTWFALIQRQYQENKLPKERITQLRGIHFPFAEADQSWLNQYNKIETIKRDTGALPDSTFYENLFYWLCSQLQAHNDCKLKDWQSTLLEELDPERFRPENCKPKSRKQRKAGSAKSSPKAGPKVKSSPKNKKSTKRSKKKAKK